MSKRLRQISIVSRKQLSAAIVYHVCICHDHADMGKNNSALHMESFTLAVAIWQLFTLLLLHFMSLPFFHTAPEYTVSVET